MAQSWDEWLGDLSLSGIDPRNWDLNRLLGAFEAALRRGAKDESEWRQTLAKLEAPPAGRKVDGPKAGRAAMSVSRAEALIARFAALDG